MRPCIFDLCVSLSVLQWLDCEPFSSEPPRRCWCDHDDQCRSLYCRNRYGGHHAEKGTFVHIFMSHKELQIKTLIFISRCSDLSLEQKRPGISIAVSYLYLFICDYIRIKCFNATASWFLKAETVL